MVNDLCIRLLNGPCKVCVWQVWQLPRKQDEYINEDGYKERCRFSNFCNTCYRGVDWFCSRRAPPPPPWDSPPARISCHNRATHQECINNKRRTHQEDIYAALQQHITNSLAARSPTNSTNRHQEFIGSVNFHLIIIKHGYASTNYCFTHLRALLVLQAPRHFGTRNYWNRKRPMKAIYERILWKQPL